MHIGLQAPSPSSGAFPASPKPPLPLAGGSRRSYRYRAGRARFLVSRAKPRAPRVPQVPDLPAFQMTPLPHLETSNYRYPAVSRRSHGYRAQRARLSVTRAKSPPLCVYRAPAPPAPQCASLPQPRRPHHPPVVETRRPRRYRAPWARYSVSCAKPAPLVHPRPQAPQPFN
jgi:hypothetical protein